MAKETKSKKRERTPEERQTQVVTAKRRYFVPALGRSIEAENTRDASERAAKQVKSKVKGERNA